MIKVANELSSWSLSRGYKLALACVGSLTFPEPCNPEDAGHISRCDNKGNTFSSVVIETMSVADPVWGSNSRPRPHAAVWRSTN